MIFLTIAIIVMAIAVFMGPELLKLRNMKNNDSIGPLPLPKYECDECAQGFDEDIIHYYRDGDEPCFGRLVRKFGEQD